VSLNQSRVLARITLALAISGSTSTACGQSDRGIGERPVAVGWVQAAGEIRIYSRMEDLGNLYDGSCISGVMVNGQTLPDRLQNKHVWVYGTLVEAKDFYDRTAKGVTSGVENYCASLKIAIITRIVER
jgi:hypothetical protein